VIVTGYAEKTLVRGLSYLAERQAAIANNLANVDTTSFKRRATVAKDTGARFQSMLDQRLSAVDYTERSDMQRGILRETGNRFDVAIDGPSWFRVQGQDGQRYYTRNGQFQVGSDGRLVTRDGYSVLDQGNNPIVLGNGNELPSDLNFSPNGQIANPSTGQTWGPLALVDLPDQHSLVPVGKSLFVDPKEQRGTQANDGVQQGFLEGSNVDSLQELVAMIAVERSFAATRKALSGLHRIQDNLITNILR
jgi:flagellar basal-body rod protein FlgF